MIVNAVKVPAIPCQGVFSVMISQGYKNREWSHFPVKIHGLSLDHDASGSCIEFHFLNSAPKPRSLSFGSLAQYPCNHLRILGEIPSKDGKMVFLHNR